MSTDRFLAILDLLNQAELDTPGAAHLCSVAAYVNQIDGAGIALCGKASQLTPLCASTPVSQTLMDIESTVGEGPCMEAFGSEDVIIESVLGTPDHVRWPAYGPLARAEGVRAVFGFPVRIGAIRLGALMLYRRRSGALTDEQSSDSHLMASIVARAILAFQAGAPRGELSNELQRAATFDFVVQQAAGMVAVQGAMSVGDALVTLRAHGFATGVTSSTLANRIVARELRFEPIGGEWVEAGPNDALFL